MANFFNKSVRKWLRIVPIIKNHLNIISARKSPNYSTIKPKQISQQQQSIIFLCPATEVPQGGIKVIYKQAAIINETKGLLSASVLHPYNLKFTSAWFTHGATAKRDLYLDQTNDFVMIPEFWAVPHAKRLHNLGVRYGIYVQGGYVMGRWGSIYGEDHDAAYQNAALILAISDDTVECIKMAYPECADKVYRVHYSVNADKFNANSNKENIICYMPRKMKNHSQLVTFFLSKWIPRHWKIESIDGLDEDRVAAILGKSRIFLSFSELEGCPLPPVEAALAGCHVIGYTGEGAKEYWDPKIFTEIYSGDIKAYVKAILNKISEIDRSPSAPQVTAIKNLADRYSAQIELMDMQFVSKKVAEILGSINNS